jgi:hypothetical protein
LVLGVVFAWTGSFAAPLALHIIYNGMGVFMSYLPASEEGTAGYGIWLWLIGSLAVFATGMVLLYKTRQIGQKEGEVPNG